MKKFPRLKHNVLKGNHVGDLKKEDKGNGHLVVTGRSLSGRHKWNGKVGNSKDGLVVACLYCGCVKQVVKGFPTYFKNDTVYDKIAPKCAR